jgi:hypothetical protein
MPDLTGIAMPWRVLPHGQRDRLREFAAGNLKRKDPAAVIDAESRPLHVCLGKVLCALPSDEPTQLLPCLFSLTKEKGPAAFLTLRAPSVLAWAEGERDEARPS